MNVQFLALAYAKTAIRRSAPSKSRCLLVRTIEAVSELLMGVRGADARRGDVAPSFLPPTHPPIDRAGSHEGQQADGGGGSGGGSGDGGGGGRTPPVMPCTRRQRPFVTMNCAVGQRG